MSEKRGRELGLNIGPYFPKDVASKALDNVNSKAWEPFKIDFDEQPNRLFTQESLTKAVRTRNLEEELAAAYRLLAWLVVNKHGGYIDLPAAPSVLKTQPVFMVSESLRHPGGLQVSARFVDNEYPSHAEWGFDPAKLGQDYSVKLQLDGLSHVEAMHTLLERLHGDIYEPGTSYIREGLPCRWEDTRVLYSSWTAQMERAYKQVGKVYN